MAGIETSRITTAAANDLTIQPASGKKTLLKSVNSTNPGVTPIATASDGEVKALKFSDLNDITDQADEDDDWMMIQDVSDGNKIKKIQAGEVLGGGGGVYNPTPGDISSSPPFLGGSGTETDPFRLTPEICGTPGAGVDSRHLITVSGGKDGKMLLFEDVSVGVANGKFEQDSKIFAGPTLEFVPRYNDRPTTSLGDGQVYKGKFKTGEVFFAWDVTQIANKTVLGPISSPNANPNSVNYAPDNKYGFVSGTWADGTHNLSASSNMEVSKNGGSYSTISNVQFVDGNTFAVAFKKSAVDGAANGAIIEGKVSSPEGYLSEFALTKDNIPTSFSFSPQTDVDYNKQVESNAVTPVGYNCQTSVALKSNTLTSVQVSINSGAWVNFPTNIHPGQSIRVRGSTGGGAGTAYNLVITLGGAVDVTWTVTTSSVAKDVARPDITSPVNLHHVSSSSQSFTSSAYSKSASTAGHKDSTWEIYKGPIGRKTPTSAPIVEVDDSKLGLPPEGLVADPLVDNSYAPYGRYVTNGIYSVYVRGGNVSAYDIAGKRGGKSVLTKVRAVTNGPSGWITLKQGSGDAGVWMGCPYDKDPTVYTNWSITSEFVLSNDVLLYDTNGDHHFAYELEIESNLLFYDAVNDTMSYCCYYASTGDRWIVVTPSERNGGWPYGVRFQEDGQFEGGSLASSSPFNFCEEEGVWVTCNSGREELGVFMPTTIESKWHKIRYSTSWGGNSYKTSGQPPGCSTDYICFLTTSGAAGIIAWAEAPKYQEWKASGGTAVSADSNLNVWYFNKPPGHSFSLGLGFQNNYLYVAYGGGNQVSAAFVPYESLEASKLGTTQDLIWKNITGTCTMTPIYIRAVGGEMVAESQIGVGSWSSDVPGVRVRFEDKTDQEYFTRGLVVYNDVSTHAKAATIQVPYDGHSSQVWATLFTASKWIIGDVIQTDTIYEEGIDGVPAPGQPPPAGFVKHQEAVNSTTNKTSWGVSGLAPGNSYLTRVKYRSSDSPEVVSDQSPWHGIIYSP